MPTGIYLHVYIQSKAIKGKSIFYWVISLQQIIPLTPWKVIKVILIYVLIKYAKNTHAISVFAQYTGILITDFTFLCFVISFLCSLHKNRFNSKNLCGTVSALWKWHQEESFSMGMRNLLVYCVYNSVFKKGTNPLFGENAGNCSKGKKNMELKVSPVNV